MPWHWADGGGDKTAAENRRGNREPLADEAAQEILQAQTKSQNLAHMPFAARAERPRDFNRCASLTALGQGDCVAATLITQAGARSALSRIERSRGCTFSSLSAKVCIANASCRNELDELERNLVGDEFVVRKAG
jgi:hypothetical protein